MTEVEMVEKEGQEQTGSDQSTNDAGQKRSEGGV